MRKECAICGNVPEGGIDFPLDFIVPDGWELPEHSDVKYCDKCGFVWYDNNKTQADYDAYYEKRYGYGLLGDDTTQRYKDVASFLKACRFPNRTRILDYGGEHGEMEAVLKAEGFYDVEYYALGMRYPTFGYDLVICSHVLEHVYDINPFLDKVCNLAINAVLIDGPYFDFPFQDHSPLIDLHQKHINHFRVEHVDRLFEARGFKGYDAQMYWLREGDNYRKLYRRDRFPSFQKIKNEFEFRTQVVIDNCNAIGKPVIVWGLGDIAWYTLAHTNMDVVYFVDNDPAYRGATIMGKPVLEKPISDEPIVVIAAKQSAALIERIKRECDNEIIQAYNVRDFTG